ncbi:MAG: M20 family peptidase, partial [Acetomicrobium sp.]
MKDDRFDRLANELLRLIEIPSPSGNEGPILEYLENRLRFLKVPTKIQPILGKTGNLVLNPGSKTLLDLHVDTVPGVMEGVRCSA